MACTLAASKSFFPEPDVIFGKSFGIFPSCRMRNSTAFTPCCPLTTDGGMSAYQLFVTERYTSRMYGLKSTPWVLVSISIPHAAVTPLGREPADCSVKALLAKTPAVWVARNGVEAARAKTTIRCATRKNIFSAGLYSRQTSTDLLGLQAKSISRSAPGPVTGKVAHSTLGVLGTRAMD